MKWCMPLAFNSESQWIDLAVTEQMEEAMAGFATNVAASEALAFLIRGWKESATYGVSCAVLVHDLLEVAERLMSIHDGLKSRLPGALYELAATATPEVDE